jgi:hypothetical protein
VTIKLTSSGQPWSGPIQFIGRTQQPGGPSREVRTPPRLGASFGRIWLTAIAAKESKEPATSPSAEISHAKPDASGILVHDVRSPDQAKPTEIRVLLPGTLEEKRQYPVVFVLPVEAGRETRYGDGLAEIRQLDLHNRRQAVFVAPTFAHLPWYADHPTNRELRQETYFLKTVVPFIARTYPVKETTNGRLLLGFSKSGWGAWSLLLRHPDEFGNAVAWDAPLMMEKPGKYGSGPIFGDEANFANYQVSRLLEQKADQLNGSKRLILLGYGNFRGEHEAAHALLDRLKIPHEYRDGPSRKHDWHSGWVEEAVDLLLAN